MVTRRSGRGYYFRTPRPGCEVGESFATAVARQLGPTMAHRVDCNSVDTVETRVRYTKRRMMAALEVVNLRLVGRQKAEAVNAGRVRTGYDNNGSRPRPTQAVRDCSYSEFLKCKPLDFKGTEGVCKGSKPVTMLEGTRCLQTELMDEKNHDLHAEHQRKEMKASSVSVLPEELSGSSSDSTRWSFKLDFGTGACNCCTGTLIDWGLFQMKELSAAKLKELSDKRAFKTWFPHPRAARSWFVKKKGWIITGIFVITCLAGYYRRFIEGFSKIAKPMTKLTQKKVKFVWGDKQEAAFQLLKQKLCDAPILALPEGSKDFIAYCDASKNGLGVVLMQREKCYALKDLDGSYCTTKYSVFILIIRAYNNIIGIGRKKGTPLECRSFSHDY
ncbi:putative reverse transcriptase domain-containing protein [Tanacetum coccineum]